MSVTLSPRVRVACRGAEDPATVRVQGTEGATSVELGVHGRRLRVGLVLALPAGARVVDVSIDPALLVTVLEPGPTDRDEDAAALARWVGWFCEQRALWANGGADLTRALGGAAYPLLGQVYDRGARTLAEIPRWAAPALAQATARDAGRAVFGPSASRPLIAALAMSLLPGGDLDAPPALHLLALALMGKHILGPDQLARILRSGSRDCQPPLASWPSVEDIKRFQTLAPQLGAPRAARLLSEAAARTDGPALLASSARLLAGLPSAQRVRLPSSLTDLHARCLELTPTAPAPAPPVAPATPPRPRQPARAPNPRAARPATRRTAPSSTYAAPFTPGATPTGGAVVIRYPPATWALHGRLVSPSLRLVLPRTIGELDAWGRAMRNCLGSFAASAAAGQSVIIGVERNDSLAYCAEITPTARTIRQFVGRFNRPIPVADAGAICRVLVGAGLVDRHHRINRPWMDLVRLRLDGHRHVSGGGHRDGR